MKYCKKMSKPWEEIGIYVELALSDEDTFRYKLHSIQPYRVSLKISLPKAKQSNWHLGIAKVLLHVEAGNAWPIRFDFDNASRYLSEEQLKMVEYYVPRASFYMYGKPEKSSFSEESLRRWQNGLIREYRKCASRS